MADFEGGSCDINDTRWVGGFALTEKSGERRAIGPRN